MQLQLILKYKIRNVIIISKEEIRVGDYILCKEFNYKYEKDVTITVVNFEKFGNNSLAFLMDLNEFKKDELIDCYFIYRKESKTFQGFNNETMECGTDINTKIKIEESKVYLFHRLQKLNEKMTKYNKKYLLFQRVQEITFLITILIIYLQIFLIVLKEKLLKNITKN